MNHCLKATLLPQVQPLCKRNLFVVRHAFPIPVTPPDKEQRPPTDKQLFQKYTLVEDTNTKKMPRAKMLLIKNVEGIGKAGEILSIRSHMVREYFIPSGSAVYATPFNIEKYSKLTGALEQATVEPHVKLGISRSLYNLTVYINSKAVPVYVALEDAWTLQKWHLVNALRMHDVHVNEDNVVLNHTSVMQGPNLKLQNQLFRFYLVANKTVVIPCYGRIQHVTTKTFKQMLTPSLPDPTSLSEQESRSAGLIEEDVHILNEDPQKQAFTDEEIWILMQKKADAAKKEIETSPLLLSRRQQAILDEETKLKRKKEAEDLRCAAFDIPRKLDSWDEREFRLACQRAKRNRYWDDDKHNWQLPMGKF